MTPSIKSDFKTNHDLITDFVTFTEYEEASDNSALNTVMYHDRFPKVCHTNCLEHTFYFFS